MAAELKKEIELEIDPRFQKLCQEKSK